MAGATLPEDMNLASDYVLNEQRNIVLRNRNFVALQNFYKLNSFLIYRVVKLT